MMFTIMTCTAAPPVSCAEMPEGTTGRINLAKNKTCTLTPPPNHELCKDPEDHRQLTDGTTYTGPLQLWTQKTTVGWRTSSEQKMVQADITVDLERVEPIGEVSFHTAFDGPLNVYWPLSIKVLVSENGSEFAFCRDLANPLWEDELGAPVGANEQKLVFHRFSAPINAKGRYVRLIAQSTRMLFCDEIEIFRGDESLSAPRFTEKTITDIKAFLKDSLLRDKISGTLLRDIERVKRNASNLPSRENDGVNPLLAQLQKKTETEEQKLSNPNKAVAPLNEIHRDILRVNAKILKLEGYPTLVPWHKNRWAPLVATEKPPPIPLKAPSLAVTMMKNEYRAETLNLTNTTEKDLDVEISFAGLPGGTTPDYISVHQVEFVGTQMGGMIADPLIPAKKTTDACKIVVPSGMTRQIWLSFHPQEIAAGFYHGSVIIKAGVLPPMTVPLNLHLYPFQFPSQPRLSLAMFDYTDKPYGFKNTTDQNVHLAIKDMREHFVDTAYGHRTSACWPEKDDFDTEGNLVKPLRTTGFDDWVDRWKGIRRFHLYTGNDLKNFCGEPMGTPRFNRMVEQWAAAFAKHIRMHGIKTEHVALHLFDEPMKDDQFSMNFTWGKAIKAGAPDLPLFTDTSAFKNPGEDFKQMIGIHDIICPGLPECGEITDSIRTISQSGKNKSKQFWLYSCWGPARLFDPYYYHRLQAWHCWRNGAIGMAFWNYWNDYKNKNCAEWNEFSENEKSYGVSYTTPDSVTAGKHWEAIREGVEDYEYLHMLSSKIENLKGKSPSLPDLSKAEQLLSAAPSLVAGQYELKALLWSYNKDRTAADQARIRILEALEKLQ